MTLVFGNVYYSNGSTPHRYKTPEIPAGGYKTSKSSGEFF